MRTHAFANPTPLSGAGVESLKVDVGRVRAVGAMRPRATPEIGCCAQAALRHSEKVCEVNRNLYDFDVFWVPSGVHPVVRRNAATRWRICSTPFHSIAFIVMSSTIERRGPRPRGIAQAGREDCSGDPEVKIAPWPGCVPVHHTAWSTTLPRASVRCVRAGRWPRLMPTAPSGPADIPLVLAVSDAGARSLPPLHAPAVRQRVGGLTPRAGAAFILGSPRPFREYDCRQSAPARGPLGRAG